MTEPTGPPTGGKLVIPDELRWDGWRQRRAWRRFMRDLQKALMRPLEPES